MIISGWYDLGPLNGKPHYHVSYYHDAWDVGLTYSHREFWL